MTTDQTTTAPALPDWMDLDGYCPPEVRDQMTAAATRLEQLAAPGSELDQAIRQAFEANYAYEPAPSIFGGRRCSEADR